jgi:hypothetical protein
MSDLEEMTPAEQSRQAGELAKRLGHTISAIVKGQPPNRADVETMQECVQFLYAMAREDDAAVESRNFAKAILSEPERTRGRSRDPYWANYSRDLARVSREVKQLVESRKRRRAPAPSNGAEFARSITS